MTNRDHSPSVSQNDGGDAKLRTEGSGLDLDALEKVAREATPGPWSHDPQEGAPGRCLLAQVWDADGHSLAELESTDDPGRASASAEHIATFDPPTVLRLIHTQRELVAARDLSAVLSDVAEERTRQVQVEGWTPEHDDQHLWGSLANAGAAYALGAMQSGVAQQGRQLPPHFWPWSPGWWKPKGGRPDLIRAAALIVAEIERLDRFAAVRAATTPPPPSARPGEGGSIQTLEDRQTLESGDQ